VIHSETVNPLQSFHDFKTQLLANPSPWFGGIVSGALTAGIFGWISHVRSVRPVLVFLHKDNVGWFVKNIGVGPAIDVVLAEANNDKKWVLPTLYYPIAKDDTCTLLGLGKAEYLGMKYTDVNGHWYSTVCGYNKNKFKNHWFRSLFGREPLPEFGIILRKIGELEAVQAGKMPLEELNARILKRKMRNSYEQAE
jgi:hypothetical protein